MAFHKKKNFHLIFIEIDPLVAIFEDVYFTDSNATRLLNGHTREKGVKGLLSVKFDIINSVPRPNDKRWIKYVQAEVLVPNHIPIEFFKKIHFISESSLKLGQYLWSGNCDIFSVTPSVFADYHRDTWVIINPYLDKITMTYEEVTKYNVQENHADVENIIRGKTFWIKVSLFAVAGSKTSVILRDLNNDVIVHNEVEFWKESGYYWYPKIKIPEDYYHDEVILEVFLDEILWYKEKKKVLK